MCPSFRPRIHHLLKISLEIFLIIGTIEVVTKLERVVNKAEVA